MRGFLIIEATDVTQILQSGKKFQACVSNFLCPFIRGVFTAANKELKMLSDLELVTMKKRQAFQPI